MTLNLALAVLLTLGALLLICGLIGMGRAVVRRISAAPYDDSDKHRCPTCDNLAADEANGILRTDFELWESEWTP